MGGAMKANRRFVGAKGGSASTRPGRPFTAGPIAWREETTIHIVGAIICNGVKQTRVSVRHGLGSRLHCGAQVESFLQRSPSAILGDAFVFRVSDQKAIVIVVVDGMADVDIAAAELNAAQLVQFAAVIDTFILGHIFVFACAAGGGNHFSPLRL